MDKFFANKFIIAHCVILAVGLAIFGYYSFKDNSYGPSIKFVDPTNKNQSFASRSHTTTSVKPMRFFLNLNLSSAQKGAYANYEIKPIKSLSNSQSGYQPISRSSYALPANSFGNSLDFSGSSSVSMGVRRGNVSNTVSNVTTSFGVIALANKNTVSTPSEQIANQESTPASSQIEEPFSDASGAPSVMFRLPDDPGEPFPDEPVPVGNGVAFLCCCALAYIGVKLKVRNF